MDNLYEVTYTIYNDRNHDSYDSQLHQIRAQVQALHPQQARAMVEAQYQGLAHVWSVYQK